MSGAFVLASLACASAASAAQGFAGAPSGGIWKAVVPAKPMKGAFDNLDPIGLAAGARIPADCSINWVDPDSHQLYCFSSGTSLEIFLDRPQYNIARARAGWQSLAQRRR